MTGGWREWAMRLWQHDRSMVLRFVVVGLAGLVLLVWGTASGGAAPAARTAAVPGGTSLGGSSTGTSSSPLMTQELWMDSQLTRILTAVPNAGAVSVAVSLAQSAREQYTKSHVPLAQMGPAVQGVVVVASGAKGAVVREELTQAVETLLQIPAYQVLVLPNAGA